MDEVVSENGSSCVICPELTWPDDVDGTTCEDIEPTYLTWTGVYGPILTGLSAGGVLFTILVLVVVITQRERRVIKVSDVT